MPTAVMEAQHVSRISLLRGLDDPDDRPLVEILVPGGELRRTEARPPDLYAAKLSILPSIALFFGHRRSSATLHAGTTVESSLQLEGAAGIEAEWESPVSFHAAVASEAEGEEKVAEVVDAVSGIRVRGTADAALDRIRAVERSYRESAASRGTFIYETDPSVVNRLTLVSHDADEYIAKRAGADLLGTASGATAISTFEPRSMKPRHRAVAAWGEFEAGADPFSLSAGGRTQVSLRIALAMAAASPAILDVQVRGELRIDTPGGFEGRFAKGSFRGSVTTFTVRGDASEGPETETLELAFDLLRQPAERGREAGLRVLLSVPGAPEGAGLELAARWDADEVDLSLATGLTEQKTGIAHMTLLRSAEGLGVGHPARVSANHGLRLLDAALGSTAEGFSARAARLLFPERTRPHDEVSIAAQRDWVAFRTARTEICEADLVRPVTAVPRRYALFHLRVDSADEAMRIHAALLEGNDRVIATRPIRGFGVCEFAAGDATLLSSVAQLQQAFGDTNPGNRWACAVIASSTAALGDGVDLAAERLAALQRALAPQTAEPGVNQVATRVPAALELQGSDGSIAIITHEAMTTTCHEVYVGLPDAGLERILHLVLKEGIAGAHTQKMMSLIGEVTFVKGTAEVVDNTFDPVRATWLPQRERLSLRGLALFVPERETEEVVAAARAQASKMLGGLDAEGVPVHVSRIPSEIPGGCIAASTLLVETRRSTEVNVVMMRGNEVIDMERRIAMRIAPDGRLTNPISDEEMRILGERTRRSARLSSLDRADDPRVNDVVRTVRAEFERRGLIRPGTDPRAGADLTFAQREALRNAGVSEGLVMILHDR